MNLKRARYRIILIIFGTGVAAFLLGDAGVAMKAIGYVLAVSSFFAFGYFLDIRTENAFNWRGEERRVNRLKQLRVSDSSARGLETSADFGDPHSIDIVERRKCGVSQDFVE